MGIQLSTARKIARLTQRELAEKVDVDKSLIGGIESKRRRIQSASFETVVRIARVLNIEPEELAPVEDFVSSSQPQDRRANDRRHRERRTSDERRAEQVLA